MTQPLSNKSPKDIARLQFDVRRAQLDMIDGLVDVCGLSSKKELFNNAIALMQWAVQETQKGRRVASYDVNKDDLEMVALPALSFAAPQDAEAHLVSKASSVQQRPSGRPRAVGSAQLGLVET